MNNQDKSTYKPRTYTTAQENDTDLGPLKLLPGAWKSLPGRGWNMIALPFATEPDSRLNYRLLVNQYNEDLNFSLVDKAVPNRGIQRNGVTVNADQSVVTLDYQQSINQIAADDFPLSGLAGVAGLPIHHEPGLWLNMADEKTDGLNIARLSSIPHGDSVLALGTSKIVDGAVEIPDVDGLPIGVTADLSNPYLAPYNHYHTNPFKGTVNDAGFPGFDPTQPNELLKLASHRSSIKRTTVLEVDTTIETGGISNLPFIVKQANAASMKSTFWIQEVGNDDGSSRLLMQYSQIVILDFFNRRDGHPGVIRWPHVSINTLETVVVTADSPEDRQR
jgi:hypothetical protein